MAFFEELGKKVSKAAQTAAKKSSELVEITKLNANISAQEDKIKKCYIKMGQLCFTQYKADKLESNELSDICKEIVEYQEKIKELNEQIAKVKSDAGEDVSDEVIMSSEQENIMPVNEAAVSLDKDNTAI